MSFLSGKLWAFPTVAFKNWLHVSSTFLRQQGTNLDVEIIEVVQKFCYLDDTIRALREAGVGVEQKLGVVRIERTIHQKLLDLFQPEHLEIINESFMHNVPKGSETHFKIILVSKDFEGKNLLQRHRQINKCLWDELQTGVHALSIVAHTNSEWKEKGEVVNRSPPCMGGDAGRH